MKPLITLALALYPPTFRARFGAPMAQACRDRIIAYRESHGRMRTAVFAARAIGNLAMNGLGERLGGGRVFRHGTAAADRVRVSDGGRVFRPGITLFQDLAYALRIVRRRPALAIASTITLAVGIGASTVMFSLVDGVLLRPLPYQDPAGIVSLLETSGGQTSQVSLENVLDWKRESRLMAAVSPIQAQSVNLTSVAEPDRLRGGFITSDFFDVIRVAPALGRPFTAADDVKGAAVAILDHRAFQVKFAGDARVIGRTIALNNVPVTVVGVMPEGFHFPFDDIDVWLPVWQYTGGLTRRDRSMSAVGRLGPGATLARAQAELSAIAARLAEEYPATNAGRGVALVPYQRWLTNNVQTPLGLVFGLVIVLLLVAASNVTGLQLGAALERRHELAVRLALGASRFRIARQILAEHLALATLGGVGGIALAAVLVPQAIASAPQQIYGLDRVSLDWRVLIFAFAVTAFTGLASGLVPAWLWSSRGPADDLRPAGRVTAARRATRLRAGLVAAEVALATVLLVASGLIVRSYTSLLRVDAGFAADRVLSMEYRLPRNKYATAASQAAFHDDVIAKVAAVPGVQAAAVVRALPFSGNNSTIGVLSDLSAPESAARQTAMNTVTERYFDALGIPVLAGRVFTDADRDGADTVVVVSRSFAEREWPGQNPIDRSLRIVGVKFQPRVIGVVGDVRHASLDDPNVPAVYASNRQNPGIFMTLVARTMGDPMAIAPAVRQALWSIDPDQPVWKVRTLASLVDRSLELERFLIGVLGLFGLSAVVLAVVGLFGVVAQSIGQRTREIGVRIALGSTPAAAGRLIVSSGLWVTGLGLAAGLPLAVFVSRLMRGLLHDVGPLDAITYAGVIVVLGVVSILACAIPARRAAALDPARILRE